VINLLVIGFGKTQFVQAGFVP